MRPFHRLTLTSVVVSLSAFGQTGPSKPHGIASATSERANDLRVTHVSLYKNGVGFFEHEGSVTGDGTVSLDLSTAQLNDALQTLTVIDLGGGRIVGANYNSTTPLEQQLGTLPFSLGPDPSEEQLYSALRGARVEVSGSGPVFTGRILSLEIRDAPQVATEDTKTAERPVAERRFLTVIADSGATRTLALTPVTTVRLLDAGLRSDLNRYLELLDRNRSEGVRHLVLSDRGAGTRALRVSFLSEVPVWKSTYRLLTTGSAAMATLQGFSVVDNTTGEDWKDVKLSLIAGNPQSFLQPLAQPIYDRRPEVPIAEDAQVTPQTHESATSEAPPNSASAQFSSTSGGSPMSLWGSASGMGNTPTAAAANGMPYLRGRSMGGLMVMKDSAPPPIPYENSARDSIAPNTTTAAFDDFFAYNVSDPVTIPRNGSALVPVLQVQVPTESVTLWSVSQPRPLRALWITNNSQLTLDRGSFSVVEDGAFAGEGLLDPVHPGERRLLSYALDEAVRVTPGEHRQDQHITSVSVTKGVLRAAETEVIEANYTISNAASGKRTVIVEEPRRPGYSLDPEEKPEEIAPNAYRFRVAVAPQGTGHLEIIQRHISNQYFQLADASQDQLVAFLRGNGADNSVIARLEPVFAARRAVADLEKRIREDQGKVDAIATDQKRLRENLVALKGSPEERELIRRYTGELNAQEDTLTRLQADLASLEQQRSAAEAELSQRIDALQITGLA